MADVNKEVKKAKKVTEVKKTEPAKKKPIRYVHIDTFLQTAIPLYNLSNMQASGFKARMIGRHYQRDEQVFVDELKKYLNLK